MIAKKAGLKIKINAVALKGINDNEILNLVHWCGENKFALTFIEVMPMGEIGEKRADQYMPLTDVRNLIQTKYSLTDDPLRTGGPARYVHCHETDQKIGFITPHTHNFCEMCNRVRITCTGEMYMCLGQQDKADLKPPLRKSENNQLLKNAIYKAISRKPKGHDFVIERKQDEKFVPRHMNVTGG
jgi:cyclic pyranopterin phosphate synthase